MAAGEGDSDWGGDAAADTTTTEELLPAGRSSNLDHSGQQHVRLQEEELHHFLLNKKKAAAAAETHVSLKESEAAAGAPGASPDEPTISVSKFPLPENNDHPGQDEKDDPSFTLALSERDSGNVVSSQSTAMEMLENINSIDDEIPSTSPGVTGEVRDLMPDLVSKSGLGVQSERTANVGPSPIERDQVETELQIGIPSHVGPSKLSTGAPVLERDSQEACDLGLEEERLLYDLSESPSCCDQGPEESRSSTEGEADVRSGVLEPVSEAKDVGRWKEETVVSLKIRIKELETQLHDQTEWAQQKVMQAARRLSKDLAELKALRQAREEMLRLKSDQKALEDSTMKKLSEMESALKKASGQVHHANAAVLRLENENAEVRAEMEAAKLNAAESIGICQEIAKRDKKSSKQAQAWERQKVKLQENLSEERQKLTQMQQQLAQAKERQQQAEVRRRQEEKAKEEAVLRADSEKRLREQAEVAAKRREETIRRKAEADKLRHRDDIQRLEQEITALRVSAESSHLATWHWGPALITPGRLALKEINERRLPEVRECQDFSTSNVHRDRECVMCMCEEMSVVFLPCAHQVVCAKCNELHEKQGMRDCPSCRTPIQQRIHVYGVSS